MVHEFFLFLVPCLEVLLALAPPQRLPEDGRLHRLGPLRAQGLVDGDAPFCLFCVQYEEVGMWELSFLGWVDHLMYRCNFTVVVRC